MKELLGAIGTFIVAIFVIGGLAAVNILLYTVHWAAGVMFTVFFIGIGLMAWGINDEEEKCEKE